MGARTGLLLVRAAGVAALLVAATTVASAQSEPQRRVTVRRVAPDSAGRDSAFDVTVTVSPDGIVRMIGELMASKQLEERLAMSLRGEKPDERRSRELAAQLQSIVKRNAGLITTIRTQCAKDEMQPEGYMGVNLHGEIEVRRMNGGSVMYFLGDHPAVVSVEPGSPAQRAGVEPADEIVMIAGNDARRPFPLRQLLKPGAKLSLRVLRDGRQKDLTLTVDKRPDEYGSPCAGVDDVVGLQHNMPQGLFMRQSPLTPGSAPDAAQAGASTGGRFGYAFVTPFATPGSRMIGGATLLPLDAEWREMVGTDKGLLVISVAPGSPSQSAGLRKSDVIVAVGDIPLTTTRALLRAVNDAQAQGVTLHLLRAGKKVTVVLKTGDER